MPDPTDVILTAEEAAALKTYMQAHGIPSYNTYTPEIIAIRSVAAKVKAL